MKTKGILIIAMVFLLVISCVMPVLSQPLGMVSYWKFDEGSGSAASDSVDANHGTIYGASWTAGQVGNALSFDGADDYVLVEDAPVLRITTPITLEAWIYQTGIGSGWGGYGVIVQKGGGTWTGEPDSGYDLAVTPDYLLFALGDGTPWQIDKNIITIPASEVSWNSWHHVVGLWNGSAMKIYLDGILKRELGRTATPVMSSSPLIVGNWYPHYDEGFKGIIDEVAIYDRALTAEEIWQHYQNGLKGQGYFSTYTLKVHVQKRLGGMAIKGVNVTVYKNIVPVGSALTDENGDAVFQVPAGTYTVIAKRHLFWKICLTKQQTAEITEDTTVVFTFLF